MRNLADKPIGGCFEIDNGRMTDLGLTLRQHYAGLALQGLLAAGCSPNHAAELALSSADELLACLEPRT